MTTKDRIQEFREYSNQVFDSQITECLISYLSGTDFFTAPASTKYHGCYDGGLYDHSRSVFLLLKKLTELHDLRWERQQSVFVIGFLHDLCKVDQYAKTDSGYEYRKDSLIMGHGEKSVALCNYLPICLTMEEIACIRYHMGAFVDSKEWSYYTNAIHKYHNVLWTHTADMMATHIVGV